MGDKGKKIVGSIVDLMIGLWRRGDRDFSSKAARDAFRETCASVLFGEDVTIVKPLDGTSKDSPEWASYVAASDCYSLETMIETISNYVEETVIGGIISPEDESDSDSSDSNRNVFRRRRVRSINPSTDKRFKSNKTKEQLDKMNESLANARVKASEVLEANRASSPSVQSTCEASEDSSEIEYESKRERNSRPKNVPLPPLPMDYRLENEWIKNNIKSPDMLYSYVRKKAGDGIRWSSGLRKYFESNDFWEFAFDTLSSGGWHDSENNRPISNVSKYITKATIEEYVRHEATKHSRFEGRFKTGKELLEYVQVHCAGIADYVKTEEYCSWFLQRMNEIGWRWNNGSTINNLPGQMTKMYDEFNGWRKINERNIVGLNPDQIGDTARLHRAIERGEWKPRANGKFSAMDLKGLL